MKSIDLRSDTVTRPSTAMRKAIAEAEVGDDVHGDDPSVNSLQERVARELGKEAALYVPSGTMSNQIGVALHTQPGDQLILEAESHIYNYEAGAPAALSGLWPTLVPSPSGAPKWSEIEKRIAPKNAHNPRPSLVCLENTHNRHGGTIVPLECIDEVGRGCHDRGLKLHLDGARLFNASVATSIPLARWCENVDTVSVCFSKGLGAPVGSCLAGSEAEIAQAQRLRKRFGGGMRQAGILAAACLYALDHNFARLREDHANARLIAEGLDHPRMSIPSLPQTNIVLVDVDEEIGAERLLSLLAEQGVRAVAFGPSRIRLTVHLDVSRQDCERALSILNGLSL